MSEKLAELPFNLTYKALIGFVFFCQLVQHKSSSSYARVRGKESCPAACFYRTLIAFLCILKYVLHKNCMTGSERSNKGKKKTCWDFFLHSTLFCDSFIQREILLRFSTKTRTSLTAWSSKVTGGIMHTKYEQTFQTPERNDDDDGGGWKKSWVLVFVALKPELI